MGGLIKFIFVLVLLYVLVGGALYIARLTTGAACPAGQVHAVRMDNPSIFMGIVMWGPDAWRQVVDGVVDVGEFVSPTRCVAKPAAR